MRFLKKAILLLSLAIVLFLPLNARATQINSLSVSKKGDDVFVSARLVMAPPLIRDLRAGIQKDLVFYVDLFRHWSSWPDEYILGVRIERYLSCDSVRGEYMMTTKGRGPAEETRYGSCDDLIKNSLALNNVRLSNLRELTKGNYFVRVTAESKLRNLPPLLGQMFFFIKDKEFSVHRDSPMINLGERP
ncbi:MAG: DUF4390 domain-containing protein [Nitrospiraceae bacterium]|nr:DUF4390 domain-containing protein [Nitrospiraceae bacterium]